MLAKFSDEQLQVTDYDSTSLSGHVDVKEDGLLFLSIPYAEGWTVEIDGEKGEITSVQDAFMGIKLQKGSHDIKLKYTPAGFKPGCIVTIVSIAVIAAYIMISSVAGKKKAAKALAAGTAAEEAPSASIEEVPVTEVIPGTEAVDDSGFEEALTGLPSEDTEKNEGISRRAFLLFCSSSDSIYCSLYRT